MPILLWVLTAVAGLCGLAALFFRVRLGHTGYELARQREENVRLQTELTALEKSKEETRSILEVRHDELENKLHAVEVERLELANRVAAFEEAEESASDRYKEQLAQVTFLIQNQRAEKERAEIERGALEAKRQAELKQTWSRHEAHTEQKLKQLCQKLAIEYVGKDSYPHKGAPDNCVRLCGELVVFDSKSPQGEDLSNFPTYIKTQAEAAAKYARVDEVAKDLYFVVPHSAIECLETLYWDQAGYRVHVITPEALEPLLLSRQRLEGYELAGKLDPSDREKICVTIGKMAHGLKRRIQVDQFFTQQFLGLLLETQSLPADILDDSARIEKASKLNPPTGKRAKVIEINELQTHGTNLGHMALGLGIATPEQVEISPELTDAK